MKERLTEERLEQLKQRYKDFGNLHWMDAQEIVSELELVQAELTEKDATIKELEQKIKTVEQAIADGPQPFMTVEEYQAYLYSVIPFLDDGLREGENG